MSRILAALGLAATVGATGCRPAPPPVQHRPLPIPDDRPALLGAGPMSDRRASYRITATLDVEKHTVTGHETLVWRHRGSLPVTEVPLHLYMNAFAGPDTIFMRRFKPRLGKADTSGWGGIDVASIRSPAGVELRPGARFGEDATTLLVPLDRPVAPGEELTLELDFVTRLPVAIARTGYVGEHIFVGQWYPSIGVLISDARGQRFHANTFHADDEFFADFGTYDVELTVPDTHVVAATGVLVSARAAGAGTQTLAYRAEDVHDFAWMADPHMKILRGVAHTVGGEVEVRVYHRPGYEAFAPRHLAAAQRTLETWSRLLVPYPWPVVSIIDPPWEAVLAVGGMEYQTLFTAGAAIDVPGHTLTEEVTVHELTHNWFQGILASNEVDEPFLDEGLTEFMSGVIMDDLFGPDRSAFDLPFLRIGYYGSHRLRTDAARLATPVATAADSIAPGEYGSVAYGKTCQTLKTLEGMVGRERLLKAVGVYAKQQAFKHPTRADLLAGLAEGLGEDYGWFLGPALTETGGVDLRVGRITRADDRSEVTIKSLGRIPVRADVLFRFADGHEERQTWTGREPFHTYVFTRPSPLTSVLVDPDGKLHLESAALDDGKAPADDLPSLEAAAAGGLWVQILGAAVGL